MIILEAVLPFLGILIALVVLHELGHFTLAKLAGVRVEEFGVGMPPRIWGKRFGETLYSINWLPLGGFVRLTGEESQRVLVAQINRAGLAEKAGLFPGDVITHVNGEAVHTPEQLAAHLSAGLHDGVIEIAVQRETRTEGGTEMKAFDRLLDVIPEAGAAIAGASQPAPAASSAESASATIGRIAGLQVGPDPRSLTTKARPVRILVLAAGAGVNALLPIFLFALAALIPQAVPGGPAVIASVIGGGPAEQAGLLPGDRFVSINGHEIQNAGDVSLQIQLNMGSDVDIVVERDVVTEGTSQRETVSTERFETTAHARLAPDPLIHVVQPEETVHDIADLLGLTAQQVLAGAGLGGGVDLPEGLALALPGGETYVTEKDDTAASVARALGLRMQIVLEAAGIDLVNLPPGTVVEVPQGATGISIANLRGGTVTESSGLFAALGEGWDRSIETLVLVRNRIRSWIAGGPGIELSGPIGIAQVTGEVVEQAGWLRLIELAALLSLNLAIINILPLPMLDGGRIMFVLLEIVRRGKRISPEKEGMVHFAGFVLLITFVLVVSYFDILRAISGDSLLR